jgi:uncharacterized coiled-coil protein SlyX
MWFSMQLGNRVSDDLIDLCTGHSVRFGGAYLGDLQKTREAMLNANVIGLLRLQLKNGLSKTVQEELGKKDLVISEVQNRLGEQSMYIEKLQAQVEMMMQGIMERDKQYFEQKYPRLKAKQD